MRARVPSAYIGLWRRSGIWRSSGASDLSTEAWWFQSASFHIDLRVPQDRPAVASPLALVRLPVAELARFGAQSGFAGVTVVDGERCEWHPEFAFPALGAELDAGTMRFDTPAQLRETGIDGSYQEEWIRVAAGPVAGLRLAAAVGGLRAFLLVGEAWLAYAHGYRGDAFAANAPATGWSEFSLARLEGGQWRIVASNKPWREGMLLPTAPEWSAQRAAEAAPGSLVNFAGIDWRVTENECRN